MLARGKRGGAVLIAALIGCSAAVAPEARALEGEPYFGGFGHASVGPILGNFRSVADDLARPGSLGPGYRAGALGLELGGGGRALLGGRLLFGGKGYVMLVPTHGTGRGTARLVAGGGGLDLGYAVVNRDHWLFYPYLGAGGIGFHLDVHNKSAAPILVGVDPLAAGASLGRRAGAPTLEVGLGLQRLLFNDAGGFIVGAELGMLTAVGDGHWRDDENQPVAGLHPAYFDGGYLRLTIGGGAFQFR